MSIMSRFFGRKELAAAGQQGSSPYPLTIERAPPVQAAANTEVVINNPADLERYLKNNAEYGGLTYNRALAVAAVNRCNAILAGSIATTGIDVKKRVDDRTRLDMPQHPLWTVLKRKPNSWQTPSEFKRQMQSHVNFRGNAYAYKVVTTKGVEELLPLHPDCVRTVQDDQQRIWYEYTKRNGQKIRWAQDEIFHLRGLTLDGVTGVSVLSFARKSIELALTMENLGAKVFKNGVMPGLVFSHPNQIGKDALANLKESLDQYRGEENAGKSLILEEGMTKIDIGLTNEDQQWMEGRRFQRSDIAMFFGVPPHMIGETEKTTSWGAGIEAQHIGFVTYTLEDWFVMWEEALMRDCLPTELDLYVKFNRMSRTRGDTAARWAAYEKGLKWGVYSPNDILAFEDMNPRSDGGGDVYYDPTKTAPISNDPNQKGNPDDPKNPAKD